MNIIAVDDEPLALSSLVKQLKIVFPDQEIREFTNPATALDVMQKTPADIAFLDVEMGDLNGLKLGLHFKKVNPPINIIFVTAYTEYALAAIKMRASGYILKPATQEAIREELNNLRIPRPATHRVVVRTFGPFEVLVDGTFLRFARSKSKELFALLIDRQGQGINNAEACSLLWPEKPYDFSLQRQFQTVLTEMCRAFSAYELKDVIVRRRNFLAVDVNAVDCDLYRMLQGDVWALNTFRGIYMSGYAWPSMPIMDNVQHSAGC